MTESIMNQRTQPERFNILCLDGGGAKGFYSLGFLRELEAALGGSLASHFHAIYGTSTGAIIASLIGLGKSAVEALKLYKENIPCILGARGAAKKSAELKRVADELYKGLDWSDFKTRIGIIATNWTRERPLLFKNQVDAAYGMKRTFVPGFGCTVSDAVRASCSATPFFEPCMLDLKNDGMIEARDGGFCANNPALFAVSDALNPIGIAPKNIRLLTLGVGHYPEPKRSWIKRRIQKLAPVHILQKTLNVSANTTEIQIKLLLPQVPHIRVSDRFESPELAMDFLESDLGRLNLLVQKGRDSFSARETEIQSFFN
jgi:patatin-like phospholipase/acyl hydrolase